MRHCILHGYPTKGASSVYNTPGDKVHDRIMFWGEYVLNGTKVRCLFMFILTHIDHLGQPHYTLDSARDQAEQQGNSL